MGGRQPRRPAAPTIRARAAEIIEKHREKMRRNLGTAIDGRDPEGVHDMRVASRRLRAALGVFRPWLDKRQVQQSLRALRRLTRALGRVRELDVLRIRLDGLASRASPERKLAIETIDSRIARDRVRARARMIRAFAKVDLDQLDTRLRELAGAPPAWAREGEETSGLDAGIPWTNPTTDAIPDESIEALIETLAPQVTDAARRVVETRVPGEHGSREASETLHEIRIRTKKLRYQLETIAPYRGPAAAHLVDTLKGLQEHLGEFHDDVVLDALLADNIERQAARARPLLVAELRRLRTVRRAALRRDERECRSSLENLRIGGFAQAVADMVAAKPPEVEAPKGIDTKEAPGAAPPPRAAPAARPAPATRTAGAGYAGEPVGKPTPETTATEKPTRASHAAAAAGQSNAASTPTKS